MIFHCLHFGAFEEPMTLITVVGVIDNFELGDGDIFPCEVALIHEQLTLYHNGIAGDFLGRLIEVTRHNIDIIDRLINSIPEHPNFEQLLSSLLDLIIGSFEKYIVDGGS